MIKKFCILAAGLLFSLHASAGYIRYDLLGQVSGFIVQHDDDGSIAYYQLRVTGQHIGAGFAASGSYDTLTSASSSIVGGGPTNLSVFDDLTDFYFETLSVNFGVDPSNGFLVYRANYSQFPIPDLPASAQAFPLTATFGGYAAAASVSAGLAASIDAAGGYVDGIRRIVPTPATSTAFFTVPEPDSLALLAIGALGVAGLGRRRKA